MNKSIRAFHVDEGCMYPAQILISAAPGGKITFLMTKEHFGGTFSQMSVDLTKTQAGQLVDALTAELFPHEDDFPDDYET